MQQQPKKIAFLINLNLQKVWEFPFKHENMKTPRSPPRYLSQIFDPNLAPAQIVADIQFHGTGKPELELITDA
jgi:hypothetical protein